MESQDKRKDLLTGGSDEVPTPFSPVARSMFNPAKNNTAAVKNRKVLDSRKITSQI
jgi:hypothetical protein